MQKFRNISRTTMALLVIIAMLTTVLSVELYMLTIPSTWKVNVTYGLLLTDTSDVEITQLDWTVDRYQTTTKTLRIHNLGNAPANVTCEIPASTSEYTFTTTFVNSTIPKDTYVEFDVSLTDVDMDADLTYNGSFAWLIVDHFESGYEEPLSVNFSKPTEVVYESDCSDLLLWISDEYLDVYDLSETILYNFTTENINSSYTIDSFSYKIELWKLGLLYSTPISTMYDCIPDLEYNQQVMVYTSFNAPSENGTYQLKLYYTGHNSEYIPPTFDYEIQTNVTEPTLLAWLNTTITYGMTEPSEASNIYIQLQCIGGDNYWLHYSIKIYDDAMTLVSTIVEDSGEIHISFEETFQDNHPFTSPSEYGHYVIKCDAWGYGS